MKKFVAVFDLDDTIEDLRAAWCAELTRLYGCKQTPAGLTTWWMDDMYPELTNEQLYKPFEDIEFWKTVQPKPGAVECLKKLIMNGVEVYICTASCFYTTQMKFDTIIKTYFPFIDFHHIIVAQNKQMIRCDVMIDDGVHNLIDGPYAKLLIDMPYNQNVSPETGIIRVKNFDEVYANIMKLKGH